MPKAAKPSTSAGPIPADALLRLDQQLCFPLYAASHLVTRLYRPLLEPLGLTYPQYLAMLVLWEQSPLSVGELGQRLHLDSGTLTPLLKRLEAGGLVLRTRSTADERRVSVSLTPQGNQLREAAAGIPRALGCQLGLEVDEIVRLRADLQRFVQSLNA